MRASQGSLLLLAVLLTLSVAFSAASDVKALMMGKRTGKLVWGEFYDVPKVDGARAWTYLEMPKKGSKPIAAGLKITKQLLDNVNKIPCTFPYKGMKGVEKSCVSDMMMNFPKGSPFKHMGLNYATGGHTPVGIYSLPHFDIHFNLYSQKWMVDNLGPSAAGKCNGFSPRAWYMANRPIPSQCFPKGYINVAAAGPMLGNHMIPPTAHEFTKPGSFNSTFIYGTFGGKIIFYEPMITLKTFLAKKEECMTIPSQPKEHQNAGWYPSTCCFWSQENGDTYIELRDYTWYKAGCARPAKSYDGYLMADPKTVPAGCPYVKAPPMPKPAPKKAP